jgi:endonuclease-3
VVHNYNKVFQLFKNRYVLVPLEIFADPYRTLISTVLSARTRDEVTLVVSQKLFAKAPRIEALNQLSQEEIQTLIHGVGFYKTKAKHLKKLADIVVNDYKGVIPDTVTELIKLPGVGIKTANLTLNRAFGKPAIAVDIHVHRITNLLGWVHTKTPEQTEKELSKVLPKKYWRDINRYFVSIGRQFQSKKKLLEFLEENSLLPK